MKWKIYALLWVAVIGLFAACKKEKIEHADAYDNSYRAWLDFKKASGNSYRYMVTTGSWVGYGSETMITVTAGKVTERKYVFFEINGSTGERTDNDTWTETGAAIGSHEHGAPAVTLDEVYNRARNEWLKKRDDTRIYFETKNSGMISLAGYSDKTCADDCFRGISIKVIEKF